ncbi:MAG TPA: hypothetical protein PK537_00800 [Candidatus Limiplasma sp.]|nr:hypothetical protein [Candidatus Limiplasma sp.]
MYIPRKIIACVMIVLLLAAGFLPAATATAASASLTTIFSQDNGFYGNMFDVEVLSSSDVSITAFDVNIQTGITTVYVYYREGSYVGYETNSSAWTLAGSAAVSGMGENNPTHFTIDDIRLTAGNTYGFYITANPATGIEIKYTDGTGSYADANLKITCGAGLGYLFAGSTIHQDRIWNGTIYYTFSPVTIPQTGDPAGHALWQYLAVAAIAGSLVLLCLKRRARHAG